MAEDAQVTEHKDGTVTVVTKQGKRHHGVAVVLDTDDVLRAQAGGFANFLREYAVVGLAIGFIVGQQANAVVKSLVDTFVNPLVQMWFGGSLSGQKFIIHHEQRPVAVPWGAFVYTLIEFFFVLVAIYLIIKLFRLDKFKKPKEEKK